MTTITNFVEGNFIVNPESKEVQRPLWIVNTRRVQFHPELIVDRMISKCIDDSKPLMHLDLGLRNISKYSHSQTVLVIENHLAFSKLYAKKPYYLVKNSVQNRKQTGFLPKLLKQINQAVQSSIKLKADRSESASSTSEYGLLIQGFQALHLLAKKQSHFASELQVFIASLTHLSCKYRQIVVVTHSYLLPEEVNFALQRISTCLTRLDSFNGEEWKCTSTVRRYTGYTNEQEYVIKKVNEGRLKVVKNKVLKKQGKSIEQNEMINNLGFKAQKTEQNKQQQQALKEMIFPHLKMRQVCQPGQCLSSDCCQKQVPQDLIVLDEEQEDDDDVDV